MTAALKKAFAVQAEICGRMGSPFMERALPLMLNAALNVPMLADVLGDIPVDRISPFADAPALRLAGGFHKLVLEGRALAKVYPPYIASDDDLFAALCDAAHNHSVALAQAMANPPQTNEIRRSAVLIALGHWLTARYGKMLKLSEIGCSAGLNMHWDFYQMDVMGQPFGPASSAVALSPEWRGTAPTHSPADVHAAQGVDLQPPDITTEDGRLTLLSYLWADQPDRITLTKGALDIAAQHDTEGMIVQGDALDWLPSRLHHEVPYLHLIYSTVAWMYLPEDARAKGEAMITAHGAKATPDAPLAWFQMENDGTPDNAALTLRLWPGDIRLDMGRADFHARWIDWQAPPP
ncbi:MAG: DUF2332 domain-containing protein [Planktomarina sp.]